MTRKDYVAIAVALSSERARLLTEPSEGNRDLFYARIVKGIADVFAADNGRFDRGRFYAATGVNLPEAGR